MNYKTLNKISSYAFIFLCRCTVLCSG